MSEEGKVSKREELQREVADVVHKQRRKNVAQSPQVVEDILGGFSRRYHVPDENRTSLRIMIEDALRDHLARYETMRKMYHAAKNELQDYLANAAPDPKNAPRKK